MKSRSPLRSYCGIVIGILPLAFTVVLFVVVFIVTWFLWFGPSVTVAEDKLSFDIVGFFFLVLATGFVGESDCTGAGELSEKFFKNIWFCPKNSLRFECNCVWLLNWIISSTNCLFEFKSTPRSSSCFDLSVGFLVFEFSVHWRRILELEWAGIIFYIWYVIISYVAYET